MFERRARSQRQRQMNRSLSERDLMDLDCMYDDGDGEGEVGEMARA